VHTHSHTTDPLRGGGRICELAERVLRECGVSGICLGPNPLTHDHLWTRRTFTPIRTHPPLPNGPVVCGCVRNTFGVLNTHIDVQTPFHGPAMRTNRP
jgi:hypothetical protein